MLQSLKLRFVLILFFIVLSIVSLSILQNNFTDKIQNLYETQLALKEIEVKYLYMHALQEKVLHQKEYIYVDDVEAYANTLDVYFGLIDEDLEEFTYPPEIEHTLELYLDTFLKLAQEKVPSKLAVHDTLDTYAQILSSFTKKQQIELTPVISAKIDSIHSTQNITFGFVVFFILLLLSIIFLPIVRSILIFKNFFSHYKETSDRLEVKDLYFNEIKEIANFVNEMLKNQEKNQNIKDEFLSNMSHELRTPLNAIGGFSGILLRKLPHEAETINPIVESASHLLQLVSDILDLSKIKSGKFKIVEEPFFLHEKLNLFEKNFAPLIDKKHISFKLTYQGPKHLALNGDWFRISQILNNFMSNAIKFTPNDGEILLDVSYAKGYLKLSVTDDGIGIEESCIDKILIPFEQSNDTTAKKYGGTGLGLSISKTLTQMMGGTFEVTSTFGKGSSFCVSIPLDSIQTDNQLEEETEADEEELSFNLHVLVVEDNKTNQLLLGMLLEDLGITFDVADDGAIAVNMFEENKYAMVLMDENMPNMTGIESMLAIREKYTKVPPIIAVTANAMDNDKKRLLELGMDDFLSKPIDNDLLIATIQKHSPTFC